MKCKATSILVPFLVVTLSACGSNGNGGAGAGGNGTGTGGAGGSGSGGGAGSVACNGASVVANEANNYLFSSTLSFPPIKVAPKTELSFDWSGVKTDFIGHSLDTKKDLNSILILMWNLTVDVLENELNNDTPNQSDLTVVPLTYYPGDSGTTSAKLFDFTLNGGQVSSDTIISYFDDVAYPPTSHIYTLMAATGTTPGQGVKMIQSFQLDPSSSNTSVAITSDSTKLSYTVNLHSLTPTTIPAGQAAVTLDWSAMKTNALGQPFKPASITNALVGHYTQTPAQLESGRTFLDLQLIATKLYQGSIPRGFTVDFSSLQDDGGQSFPGIDATGTWIVALQCGACHNPAPWYLTILKPCQ